jgi:Na+/H+ antiporter NhaD/arsenite permease-like protein
LPFIGMLLTIATGPLLFPRIWSCHCGKIATGWSVLTITAIALAFGAATAVDVFLHAMLVDYLSFIALLFSLYVVAGGILVTGNLHGTPAGNAGMLFLGTVLASFVGTTGAAMIVVRPLIRANERRDHKAHVLVFAIFLVADVGGAHDLNCAYLPPDIPCGGIPRPIGLSSSNSRIFRARSCCV